MGTRIHGYIWLSPFTVHLKLRILLICYIPIQDKVFFFFNKVWIVGTQEEAQHSLQRKQGAGARRKETRRERELWTLFFFSKIFIEVWLTFSVALSSTAQQCDSVIHMQKYMHIFFFLILFHAVYDWIFNIFPYALQ